MATPNLFTTAKVVPTTQANSKAPKKVEVEIEGLERYAALDSLEKIIKTLKVTYKGVLETSMIDHMVYEGRQIKRRPENFRGVEGAASASCELRKRSSASALSAEERMLLDKLGVEYEVVDDVVETFVINPVYKDDSALLEKVSKALSTVKGLPADFIQKVEGASRAIVDEKSLDQVFTKSDAAARQLINVVGTLAVKPTINVNPKRVMEIVSELMDGEDGE